MRKYLLSPDGNFYKANLHCHTNISDGRFSPEEVKELYVSRGYSVVAYTDHDLFIPHHELTDEKFLALSGFEAEFNSAYPGNKFMQVCHLCFIAKSPDTVVMPWIITGCCAVVLLGVVLFLNGKSKKQKVGKYAE